MAPHHKPTTTTAASDSDAPETINLSQSKKDIKYLQTRIADAELAAKAKIKQQRQERDRRLKARAEENVARVPVNANADLNLSGSGNGDGDEEEGSSSGDEDEDQDENDGNEEEEEEDEDEDDEETAGLDPRVSRRMRQAMRDAENERETDSGASESASGDESGSESDSSLEEGNSKLSMSISKDHLPDDLFAVAFASHSSNPTKRRLPDEHDDEADIIPPKSRKRPRRPTRKDIVVGARSIRLFDSSPIPPLPSTLPSAKITKFLDRNLAFKGKQKQPKGWERRPANIGVLRGPGPAMNFVRNRTLT